ncbi:MAG TPA: MarR family transcriptional regulator [Actinomycetota bacterium]|nr:MarR family transcriptional regulator [Actinomycetota bacterium]
MNEKTCHSVDVAQPALRVEPDFTEEYPGADALSTECFMNIARASDQLLGELNRRLKVGFDLSISAVTVLAIIDGAGEPITPGVIAERAIIAAASTTSVLDTLERRGLVERRPHPTDRRKLLIALTSAGRKTIDAILPGVHKLEANVMRRLSEEERRQLLDLIAKVQGAVSEVAAEPAEPLTGTRRVPPRLHREG